MTDTWRGVYATRFVDRVLLDRPPPPPVYRRLSDEELAALPEQVQNLARITRGINDMAANFRLAFDAYAYRTKDMNS